MPDQQESRSEEHLSEHFVISSSRSRFRLTHAYDYALTAPLSEVDHAEAFEERERSHSGIQNAISPEPSASQAAHQVSTFYGARDFTINGNPHFMNVGKYFHGGDSGTHGLGVLKEFVSFSALHDSSAQDPERRCYPGTREAVLKQMRDWIKDRGTTKRILWLHGPAGVGKSAIAQTIAQSYGRDEVVATFFFFRSDSSRNDGNRLFPTLAWQVAKAMRGAIARALEDDCDIPRKTIEVQFDQLIAQPFQAISEANPSAPAPSLVVIIDGVDECSDEKLQRRFLNILGKAVGNNRFPIRFLISSRPEAHIQDVLRPFQSTTLCIDLASIDGWRQDVRTYLREEFSRIAAEQQLNSSTWPGEKVIEDFVSKSCGQFVYASTIIRFVDDEYSSAVSQLKIVLGLKPSNGKSPFADLDALYIEILRRQHDHEFLKDMLSLLVARNSIKTREKLGKDDAMLLDVDRNELHRKLRGMHSVLKFNPLIDVHHRSFLDFLQEPSHSSRYHISEHEGVKRYLELMVATIVRHASIVIKDNQCESSSPAFPNTVRHYPPDIKLPLQEWEEALRPLCSFQDTLLELPDFCSPWKREFRAPDHWLRVFSDLQLHLALLRIAPHSVSPSQHTSQTLHDSCLSASMVAGALDDEEMTWRNQWGRCPSPGVQRILEDSDGLDACLSSLLANLRNAKVSSASTTVNLVRSLLCFDPAEAASKIRSGSDARDLVDLVFCLIKGDRLLRNCGLVALQNARRLAVEIHARIPLFPQSLFIKEKDVTFEGRSKTLGKYQGNAVGIRSTTMARIHAASEEIFTWATLSHENICPFLGIYVTKWQFFYVYAHGENGTLRGWRRRTTPSVNEILQRVLEVAKAIQYMHLSGICLADSIKGHDVTMDLNHRARIPGRGFFLGTRPDPALFLRNDLSCFGHLFYEIYFNTEFKNISHRPRKPKIHDDAWQLIQRCYTPDPGDPLSMDEVVKEMESWK